MRRQPPSPFESPPLYSAVEEGGVRWPSDMHDYRHKYGTLSGGSALSRSMKYAETWLYGSVSARPPPNRPTILGTPQAGGYALVMCACKDFLTSSTRSKKSSPVCKKCGGSRKTNWGSNNPATAIRGFGTVRLTQPKSRPELPFLDDMKDPYDIMRKSRLQTVSSTLRIPPEGRSRAKSNSPPGRRRHKSKSPPRYRSPDTRLANRRPLTSNNAIDVNDASSRKSILECDVNPYELISQYLRNGEAVDSTYPVDDDELSDNLSENALDEDPFDASRTKARGEDKRRCRKSAPVGSRTKKGFLDALKSKWDEPPRAPSALPGVSIGGQRIRLFNNSDPLPTVTFANEFVSDSDDNEEEEIYDLEKHKAWFSDRISSSTDSSSVKSSPVPKLSSFPKRPPRKTKSALEPVSRTNPPKTMNETGGKNRVNFALDVPTHMNRRSNSLTSSASLEIKSILKKPYSTLNLSESFRPGTSTSPALRHDSSSSETGSRSNTPTTAKPHLPANLKDRKKKQVQFKVGVVQNPLQAEGSSVSREGEGASIHAEKTPEVVVTDPESSEVLRLQFFGDNSEDAQAVNQSTSEGRLTSFQDAPRPEGNSCEDPDGGLPASSRLQRSLSDRLSPGGDPASKFNDTMRLRLRVGRRDSREAFSENDRRLPEKRVLSPGRPRPREPPPPPPPPAPEGSALHVDENLPEDLTYTRHNLPSDQTLSEDQPPPPPPPPRQIFPFTKEEIEKINQSKVRSCLRPRSSSNSPVRHSVNPSLSADKILPRRTSLTFPLTTGSEVTEAGEVPMWHRESSIVSERFTPLMPLDENIPATEAFSSVTEVYEALEKNCKVIEDNPNIQSKEDMIVEKSVKLIVPPAVDNSNASMEQELSKNCTIVTVSSPTQILSVTTPKVQPNRKTSIMITGREIDNVDQTKNKTSVVIGEYNPTVKIPGSNKVTINVGGYDYQNDKNKTVQSTTQIGLKSEFKSNITIGSTNNKGRTLLILEPVTDPNPSKSTKEYDEVKKKDEITKEKPIDLLAKQEMDELIRNNVDPVEAARKNIVPHICGKISQENNKENLKTINEPLVQSNNILKSIGEVKSIDEKEANLDTQTSIESVENLEDDVFTLKEDSEENSDCYVCAKNLKKGLSNKPDDEEEVRIGLEFDSDENHYEIIRDPIYEEISETPPPLPLSPPPTTVDINESVPTRSIFEGASKYDILNYLETAKERGIVVESEDDSEVRSPEHSRISSLDLSSRISQLSNASDSSEDSCNLIISPPDSVSITSDKVRKSSVEIERNDSGVGSETSKCSRSRWQHLPASQQHSCEDCDQPVETQVTDSGLMFAPLVCRKCAKRRAERREIITEIVETEEKYGRDLRIILEEFYRPMLVAGLLTPDQLSAIFLNVEELLENNATLAEKLRDALEIAIDQGDEDLLTVNIGSIFLDAVPMLHAFESYCTKQGAASLLLANLEKEKELLRIFLRVSQMENSVLRRMNLNSFLMVPVQRVTKYPLLLARLHRVTPTHLKSRDSLRVAQTKIELHLEHINSLAKDISTTKLWRRISIINGRRTSSEIDMINIKLRKVAVDVLEWNHDEVRFAMEGKLLFTQPTDNNWRRGRTIKLSPINAMLVTLGKPTEDYQPDSDELLAFPRKNGIRDATLLLLKEKSGRYGLLREPLFLDRCIICCEADIEDYFEVQELATKDTYLFKAEDGEQTKRWFRQLQYHAQGLGAWRKRRNALANIMINGMQLRT